MQGEGSATMLNIKFLLKSSKNDLMDISREPPPENAQRVEQVNIKYAGGLGVLLAILIMVAMIMITRWRADELGVHIIVQGRQFAIKFLISLPLVGLLFPVVHEFFHAIVFPRHSPKRIYLGSWQTYCEAKMCKRRFILSELLPFLLLAILPFVALMLLMPVLPAQEATIILLWILYSVFASLADLGASLAIAFFVPAKAKVFIQGAHLYLDV